MKFKCRVLILFGSLRKACTMCNYRSLKKRLPYERTFGVCLLYTSDAADERSSVDLGGRRIIKQKKEQKKKSKKKTK